MITTAEEAPTQTHLLARAPASVRAARNWSATALSAWQLGDLGDDLALVVSELVTNAVEHSGGEAGTEDPGNFRLDLSLLDANTVRVAVHDRSNSHPMCNAVTVDGDAESGRGLFIVDTLCTAWGVQSTPAGKIVWGTLSTQPKN